MKICTTCNIQLPSENFHKRTKSSDGLQSSCKSCRKIIDADSYVKSESRQKSIKDRRSRVRAENVELMRRYKRLCGCSVCGEKEPVVLDLHHTDPEEKQADPSRLVSASKETLKNEIRKCVVLCSNCHRKVHAGIITL